ncbi:YkgJ family cysteine cluster protein [Brucepastera parasyntrophica]|uniref:YkgJ family cysteine cluster protein n=1 Tax=Brucepastera parasyntrophica TaxID=2880008 RepID=UPI00210D36B0|nr:YkgJ family cysteine cluster protein [Brucepastera parasyntrophica]ULQ59277.1 YkgJ family cysteine cluster protein [Brucepastera parasyntrophica]
MDSLINSIPSLLEGTSLADPLSGLLHIYRRIDEAQQRWIEASPFRCPSACGECCKTFEPSILEIEALFLASWIVREHSASQSYYAADRAGCVYHNPSGTYQCTVYPARPLICRLFAFSGDRGKKNTIRYKPCKCMKHVEHRTMEEDELYQRYGTIPPAMADLAREADCLLPDSAGITVPLREALPSAMNKIRFLLHLNGHSFPDSSHNPDDDAPPFPRAS